MKIRQRIGIGSAIVLALFSIVPALLVSNLPWTRATSWQVSRPIFIEETLRGWFLTILGLFFSFLILLFAWEEK